MNSITYICNYVLTYYESVKEFSNSDFILSLAKAITDDIPNVDFTTGNYDFYIDNFIYRIMEHRNSVSFSNYINVKNHVFLVVNYYKISNNLKSINMETFTTNTSTNVQIEYDGLLSEFDDLITRSISTRHNLKSTIRQAFGSLVIKCNDGDWTVDRIIANY